MSTSSAMDQHKISTAGKTSELVEAAIENSPSRPPPAGGVTSSQNETAPSNTPVTATSKQVSIYMGLSIVIAGVVGGILNILVFLSLKTFRQNSCAFYLTIMSIVNIIQLITGLLIRAMSSGFDINWTQTSLFYCKFRIYLLQTSVLISFTCYCLATIDQYFATCSRPRYHQWCNMKIAWRLCAISSIFCCLYQIPVLFFYDLNVSPTTKRATCGMTNVIFSDYITYFNTIVLAYGAPLFVSILFGILAYRNVQQIAHRTVPLVRRELDKQLTKMVLLQVIINLCALTPHLIIYILQLIPSINDEITIAILRFISSITIHLYYSYYANSFYIYICISERFRRQLIYVLFQIHLHRWRRTRRVANQGTN